jgi:pimeloyl-ACP methyl ester carboxylesterase
MSHAAGHSVPTPESVAKAFLTPKAEEGISSAPGFNGAYRMEIDGPIGKVVAYQAGVGPAVLLVHGWEGRYGDMESFIPPLLEAGYRVVTCDLPAHGESEGQASSIPICATALLDLQSFVGPVHAVIAHSVGCAIAVEAVLRGFEVERLVLIAPPARYSDYAIAFGVQSGLKREEIPTMIELLRAKGVDVYAVDTPKAATGLKHPVLILHSNDDRVVPVSFGMEVANAWKGSSILRFDGLGHRRILKSPDAVKAAISFVTSGQVESGSAGPL